MNVKYELNVTDAQLERLYKSLHVGSPLEVALQFAGIPSTQYYMWVEIASIVEYSKQQDIMHKQSTENGSIVDMESIRERVKAERENSNANSTRNSLDAYKEPKGVAILKYKNNKSFHEYADKIYDIIKQCDSYRSEIVMYHLSAIRDAARQKGSNAQSSQWFLEKTLPQYFGRKDNMMQQEQESNKKVAQVKVEFVDPETKENQDRVKAMEEMVSKQLGADGEA